MTVRQADAERITVALIPKVQEDLRRLEVRTNLSRTDLANRAITLYEFFDAQLRAGRSMIAQDRETGATEEVLVQLVDAPDGQAPPEGAAFPRRGFPRSQLLPGAVPRLIRSITKPTTSATSQRLRRREVTS